MYNERVHCLATAASSIMVKVYYRPVSNLNLTACYQKLCVSLNSPTLRSRAV